jgi:hypothetical protein
MTAASWWNAVKSSVFKTVPLNGKMYFTAEIVGVTEVKASRA